MRATTGDGGIAVAAGAASPSNARSSEGEVAELPEEIVKNAD